MLVTLKAVKTQAKTLVSSLKAQSIELSHGQALEIVAKQHGFKSWNGLNAYLQPGGAKLLDIELEHIEACDEDMFDHSPYGKEVHVQVASGFWLAAPDATAEPDGVSYVRVLDPAGREIAYWTDDEWRDDPSVVMGAILGAISRGRRDQAPHIEASDDEDTISNPRLMAEDGRSYQYLGGNDSFWITIPAKNVRTDDLAAASVSVYVRVGDDSVGVDLFPTHELVGESIGSTYIGWEEGIELDDVCCRCGSYMHGEFCSDETCPHSDWPQIVNTWAIGDMSQSEIEAQYGVKKRTVSNNRECCVKCGLPTHLDDDGLCNQCALESEQDVKTDVAAKPSCEHKFVRDEGDLQYGDSLSISTAIENIGEVLLGVEGEFLSSIYNEVCSDKLEYKGDSLFLQKFIDAIDEDDGQTISHARAVEHIKSTLEAADGDHIAAVYNHICSDEISYSGDSQFTRASKS